MLYLEDFLERKYFLRLFDIIWIFKICHVFVSVIEQLPGELRDRFTEMRVLDLAVQS